MEGETEEMAYKPTGKPPGRPRRDFTGTPEFKAAVAEAAKEAVKAAMAEVNLGAVKADLPPGSDIDGILSKLAMSIAEVSDAGLDRPRKRVAPAEQLERDQAYQRMGTLITQAAASGLVPRYRLVAKVFIGDQMIEPYQRLADKSIIPTEVFYKGQPSAAMRPVNDIAKSIWKEYIRYLGGAEEANGIAKSEPVWMTYNGLVIASPRIPPSAVEHGLSMTPEPIWADDRPAMGTNDKAPEIEENMAIDDPRRKKIRVLGTIAEPAVRGGSPSVMR